MINKKKWIWGVAVLGILIMFLSVSYHQYKVEKRIKDNLKRAVSYAVDVESPKMQRYKVTPQQGSSFYSPDFMDDSLQVTTVKALTLWRLNQSPTCPPVRITKYIINDLTGKLQIHIITRYPVAFGISQTANFYFNVKTPNYKRS